MSRQWRSDDTDPWVYGFGDGHDGALTISSNTSFGSAVAGAAGSSGGTSLTISAASTFENGDLVLIHQSRGSGVGTWELNKIASGGGGTSLTMAHNLQNTYTDSGSNQAQIVELKEYTTVTVEVSNTWSANTWDGSTGGILAFFANVNTDISGVISASARGFAGGSGGPPGVSGNQGEGGTGTGSSGVASSNESGGGAGINGDANFNGAGAGGGGHTNAGSSGGLGSPTSGSPVAGSGGTGSHGNAGLTTMRFGGGGGGGKGRVSPNQSGGNGGRGGGMVFIFSKSLTINSGGNVLANGENGSAGSGSGAGAGGSGAGGSILYKVSEAVLGSTLSTATGGATIGSGGGGGGGGAGSTGRIHADYSTSITGTTNPTIDTRLDTTIIPVVVGGRKNYAFFM